VDVVNGFRRIIPTDENLSFGLFTAVGSPFSDFGNNTEDSPEECASHCTDKCYLFIFTLLNCCSYIYHDSKFAFLMTSLNTEAQIWQREINGFDKK
jgi:hypothetical protein